MLYCLIMFLCIVMFCFFFSSRRRHTRCALVTGVQTCALPISENPARFSGQPPGAWRVAGLGLGADLGDRRRSSKASDGDQSAWPLRGLQSELSQLRSEAVSVGEIGRASCRERVCQSV